MPHGTEAASLLGSWVLTYLVHSTGLLAVAWILSRALGARRERLQELIWRLALVGGLFTATIQVAGDLDPIGGRFDLVLGPTGNPALDTPDEPYPPDRAGPMISSDPGSPPSSTTVPGPARREASRPLGLETDRAALDRGRIASGLGPFVPWILLGALATGTVRILLSRRRLFAVLRSRRRILTGSARSVLDELLAGTGFHRTVRLSASPRLRSPIAFSVLCPEICLPDAALRELSREQLRGVLGHEIAHLMAHDPLWLQIGHALRVGLFLQPLNRVACSKLRELAEFRCDAWAARRTADPVTYADCLTRVASWFVGSSLEVTRDGIPAMATGRSSLARRVTRVLDGSPDAATSLPRGALGFGLLVAVGVAPVAPGIKAILGEPAMAPLETRTENVSEALEPEPAEDLAPEISLAFETLDREIGLLDDEINVLLRSLARRPFDPDLARKVGILERSRRSLGRNREALFGLVENRPDPTPR